MPYNIQSTNPDQKFDAAVDRKLAELDAKIVQVNSVLQYLRNRVG